MIKLKLFRIGSLEWSMVGKFNAAQDCEQTLDKNALFKNVFLYYGFLFWRSI